MNGDVATQSLCFAVCPECKKWRVVIRRGPKKPDELVVAGKATGRTVRPHQNRDKKPCPGSGVFVAWEDVKPYEEFAC